MANRRGLAQQHTTVADLCCKGGVWINRLYLVSLGRRLTDQSGVLPVVVRTVQVTAAVGGHIDPTAMTSTVASVVDLIFTMIGTCRPPRLRAWAEYSEETDVVVWPVLLHTLLMDVARAIQPLVRIQLLVQDPPNAAVHDATSELQLPEVFLL